jgi:hypothetical protein
MAGERSYRVKTGKVLAHAGEEIQGGADVALLPHVAYEVRHLVDEVQADGTVAPIGAADAAAAALESALATARPHERISILKGAHAVSVEQTARLAQLVKDEEARLAAEAKSAAKPAKSADAKGDSK